MNAFVTGITGFLTRTDSMQWVNLAVSTATNIGCVYLVVVMTDWMRRLRHSRTNLRPLVSGIRDAKFGIWLLSVLNIINTVVYDETQPLITLPARLFLLYAVLKHCWVTTQVKPAPILPTSLEAELDIGARLILLVEDNAALARVYRKTFESVGINADFATSGREALSVIDIEHPKLLIIDLGLPDMNGVELLQRARAAGYKGPAIALSGAAELVDPDKLGADFSEIKSKPIRPQELLDYARKWAP